MLPRSQNLLPRFKCAMGEDARPLAKVRNHAEESYC
jgi:hypothetical protein